MGILATLRNPTLLDVAKATDKDGSIVSIVEILNLTNEILEDMTWMTGNLETGNETTIRTGLPSVNWAKYYKGVLPSKGSLATVTDTCATLEGMVEISQRLADKGGKAAAIRALESMGMAEAFNQSVAQALFYASIQVDPEKFNGFGPRFSDKSAENGQNIIDAGGTGSDNTSIWLINWHPMTNFGIIPAGYPAGLQHQDIGIETAENFDGVTGSRLRVYRDMYYWHVGLVVKDWRYVVRIANIDQSTINGIGLQDAVSPDLVDLMIDASERVPSMSMGRFVWYMNRQVKIALRKQVRKQVSDGGGLTFENFAGKQVLTFNGWPIRICDALVANEARLT